LYDFPATLCTSINHEIVHGIPSRKRVLEDGDILSIDCGVFLDGLHADSAVTTPVGRIDSETERLLRITQEALDAGIAAATVGNHVGDIGHAVQSVVEAAPSSPQMAAAPHISSTPWRSILTAHGSSLEFRSRLRPERPCRSLAVAGGPAGGWRCAPRAKGPSSHRHPPVSCNSSISHP
jgi:methionine aminopeptidase